MTASRVSPIRKQISIFLPVSDWRAMRFEAARRRIPITELCRRWMARDLRKLRAATADVQSGDR